MKHSPSSESYLCVPLGNIKLYGDSYEISRDRRYSFKNCSEGKLYFTDNGAFPAFLTIKGYILKSECSNPGAEFNTMMNSDTRFSLTIDNILFDSARLKTFSVKNSLKAQSIECRVILCCDSYINIPETEE